MEVNSIQQELTSTENFHPIQHNQSDEVQAHLQQNIQQNLYLDLLHQHQIQDAHLLGHIQLDSEHTRHLEMQLQLQQQLAQQQMEQQLAQHHLLQHSDASQQQRILDVDRRASIETSSEFHEDGVESDSDEEESGSPKPSSELNLTSLQNQAMMYDLSQSLLSSASSGLPPGLMQGMVMGGMGLGMGLVGGMHSASVPSSDSQVDGSVMGGLFPSHSEDFSAMLGTGAGQGMGGMVGGDQKKMRRLKSFVDDPNRELGIHTPMILHRRKDVSGKDKDFRRLCIVCRKKRNSFCKQCNIALCFSETYNVDCCWHKFHSHDIYSKLLSGENDPSLQDDEEGFSKRRRLEVCMDDPNRFVGTHTPMVLHRKVEAGSGKEKDFRRFCVVCRKKLNSFCKQCNVALCYSEDPEGGLLDSCWGIFHLKDARDILFLPQVDENGQPLPTTLIANKQNAVAQASGKNGRNRSRSSRRANMLCVPLGAGQGQASGSGLGVAPDGSLLSGSGLNVDGGVHSLVQFGNPSSVQHHLGMVGMEGGGMEGQSLIHQEGVDIGAMMAAHSHHQSLPHLGHGLSHHSLPHLAGIGVGVGGMQMLGVDLALQQHQIQQSQGQQPQHLVLGQDGSLDMASLEAQQYAQHQQQLHYHQQQLQQHQFAQLQQQQQQQHFLMMSQQQQSDHPVSPSSQLQWSHPHTHSLALHEEGISVPNQLSSVEEISPPPAQENQFTHTPSPDPTLPSSTSLPQNNFHNDLHPFP